MSPTLDAVFSSWPTAKAVWIAVILAAAIYSRGWWGLNRRDPARWHWGRLSAFWGGLAFVWLALASPLDPLAALLLSAHMVQHLLLMMVAPPLIWLGAPLFPIIRGLPVAIRRGWVIPLMRCESLRRAFSFLTYPPVALVIYTTVTWLGHAPAIYDTALRDSGWHHVQHAAFLSAALLFWYPMVEPYPSRPSWSRWLLIPYMLLADVGNTILSAVITFSGHVLYPYYDEVPRLAGISALDDQATAGVIMWVPGSVAFLLPLVAVAVRLLGASNAERSRGLSPHGARHGSAVPSSSLWPVACSLAKRRCLSPAGSKPRAGFAPLPIVNLAASSREPFDLLRLPVVGRWIAGPASSWLLPGVMLLAAVAIVIDGFSGPQLGSMNLAGVLPWIHWRALAVFALLVAGNLVCGACPFTLPRRLLGRWLPVGRVWPSWLRGKWLAVALLVVFLWAYEVFALWDRPSWTAWLIVGYFAAAFSVDSLFRDGTFCKHVCPIGQFNFVHSLLSPLEVRMRDAGVCAACQTKDCLHGRGDLPGCSMDLLQPAKSGNFDCTFCLNCVRACPQENVGLLLMSPGRELWSDRVRAGVGRLTRRADLAALVVVLVFGALANAGGMIRPVVQWQDAWQARLGLRTPWITSAMFVLALVVVPAVAICLASLASCRWGRISSGPRELAMRFVWSLVPLGFGFWLAHYSFHFFTSYATVIPVTQRFAADWGFEGLGAPRWVCSCCGPIADWIVRAEILFLDVGLLVSLYVAYRIAAAYADSLAHRLRTVIPWAGLCGALFAVGVWILLEPMEMRGTMPSGAASSAAMPASASAPVNAVTPVAMEAQR